MTNHQTTPKGTTTLRGRYKACDSYLSGQVPVHYSDNDREFFPAEVVVCGPCPQCSAEVQMWAAEYIDFDPWREAPPSPTGSVDVAD